MTSKLHSPKYQLVKKGKLSHGLLAICAPLMAGQDGLSMRTSGYTVFSATKKGGNEHEDLSF